MKCSFLIEAPHSSLARLPSLRAALPAMSVYRFRQQQCGFLPSATLLPLALALWDLEEAAWRCLRVCVLAHVCKCVWACECVCMRVCTCARGDCSVRAVTQQQLLEMHRPCWLNPDVCRRDCEGAPAAAALGDPCSLAHSLHPAAALRDGAAMPE